MMQTGLARWIRALPAFLLLLTACTGSAPTASPGPASTPAAATTTRPQSTPSPTAIPPSATLPATATPTPSSTPTATADPLHTACDHPYWPLRQGAMWVSKTKTGVLTNTVTAVTGDLLKAEATYREQFPDGSVQTVRFLCDKDGLAYGDAIVDYPDGHQATKKTLESSGRFLVAPAQLVTGAKWTWSLTADLSSPIYNNGVFSRQTDYHNVSSQSCTLSKTDTLSVTVGVFQVIQVDCTGTTVSTSNSQTGTYPFNSQVVYGQGIGPVDVNTLSYSIP